MTVLRRVARPMLASMFIAGGLDALREPRPKVPIAEDVAPKVAGVIPGLSEQDTETLVRVNGAVQLGAGTLLALNRLPRLSSLALAASLVPTTAAGHRFWEYEDEGERQMQQIQFLKNVSMLGGLLLAALDTAGRPGLTWRTRHGAQHAGAAVRRSRREARLAAKAAVAKGRPGLGWRTRHGVEHVGAAARRSRRGARLATKAAGASLVGKAVRGKRTS